MMLSFFYSKTFWFYENFQASLAVWVGLSVGGASYSSADVLTLDHFLILILLRIMLLNSEVVCLHFHVVNSLQLKYLLELST